LRKLLAIGLAISTIWAFGCKGGGSKAAEEILIPAGKAWVGAPQTDKEAAPEEQPIHPVDVPAFYIDSREVTFDDFARFVQETEYKTSAEKQKARDTWRSHYRPKDVDATNKANGSYPVFLVSQKDAEEYAE